MDRTALSDDEVRAAAATLDEGWDGTSAALTRRIEFPTFLVAVEFVDRMAPIAERLDHHPNLTLSWRNVGLELSTHDAGGVTEFDVALARELDPVIAELLVA